MADLVCRIVSEHPTLSGLYQVTSPAISKYDLLCMIRDAFRLDIEIVPDENEVSDRSMVGDAVLAGHRLPVSRLAGPRCPTRQ